MNLARGDHPTSEKKTPRIWAQILVFNQFRELPREFVRVGFSHCLGRSCVQFRKLFRECPGILISGSEKGSFGEGVFSEESIF